RTRRVEPLRGRRRAWSFGKVSRGVTAMGRSVRIPANGSFVLGDLEIPRQPAGIVLFAHGSGSSRRSPRNRFVASAIQEAGLATLLMDLLTPGEAGEDQRTARWRFDIPLLAGRLLLATEWLAQIPELEGLPLSYFGASTGAAAALVAAAERGEAV